MPPRLVIREVNLLAAVRQFASGKTNASLDDIPDNELDRWASLPLTHIWGMGAWRRSVASRAVALQHPDLLPEYARALPDWCEDDVVGSPYSVFAYEISRQLGTKPAFARFRKRLADRGIGLLLDFVPNHLAVDHPWVLQRPDRFVMRTNVEDNITPPRGWFEVKTKQGIRWIAHGRDPYFPPWTDTAQLDYRRAETRKAMIQELLRITELCDGVRCDMAMLVLNSIFRKTWWGGQEEPLEFWVQAIDAVRAVKPSFIFIAETYWGTENRLVELGFDAVYDKDFLTRVVETKTNELRSTLSERRMWGQRRIRFLENHDESRIASVLSPERLQLAITLLWLQPGHILWHEGLETGARIRLPVQLVRRPVEPVQPELVDFLHRGFEYLTGFPFARAEAQMLPVHPPGLSGDSFEMLIPILWSTGGRHLLWVGNLSDAVASARIPLHLSGMAGRNVVLRELRDGTHYLRDGDELLNIGLFVQLAPDGMHWFELSFQPKASESAK